MKAQGVTQDQVSLQKSNAAPWPRCPNLWEILYSLYNTLGPFECWSAMDKHCPIAVQGFQVKQQRFFFPPAQKHRTEVPLGWPPPALPTWGAKDHNPAFIPGQ